MKKYLILYSFIILIIMTACTRDPLQDTDVSEKQIEELQISENFDFKTSDQISLTIQDSKTAVYAVYAYDDNVQQEIHEFIKSDGSTLVDTLPVYDDGNQMLASGRSINGEFTTQLQLSSYVENLFILRNERGIFSSSIIPVMGTEINLNISQLAKTNVFVQGQLIAVNEYRDFFTINHNDNYQITHLESLPELDVSTVAYDPINNLVYFSMQTGKKPLYSFNPETEAFTKIKDINIYADRMAYNPTDGFLYLGTQANLYKVDPSSGSVISNSKVSGINGSSSSADIAFDSNGQLYQFSREGLYKLLPGSKSYEAEYIGAAGQTSTEFIGGLAIDYDGTIWASTFESNNSSGYLMQFNEQSRTFEKVKQITEPVIHDLAIAPEGALYFSDDTDDDGVENELDAYPDDPLLAFNNYTPGESQVGTFAFEDLWPTTGDYDFNDLVVNYTTNFITNASNKVRQIQHTFYVKNVGGSFINGFGIRYDNTSSSDIRSVSGTRLTEGIIMTNSNGTEAGESIASIIVFDNSALQEGATIKVTIKFNKNIDWDNFKEGLNPFIFINKDRARELHLPGKQVTGKFNPNKSFEYVITNHDSDSNFKNSHNLPWVIHIPYDFTYTKPAIPINEAYTFFNEWAETSGASHDDWYKDLPGYRRIIKLEN